MFSVAAIKALQIYGIVIVVSMLVAFLIKVLVTITGKVKPAEKAEDAPPLVANPPAEVISGEVIAAISSAITVVTGPHRILHIAESKRSWSSQGRVAQHSHQPRH